jgi:hypothetical protein
VDARLNSARVRAKNSSRVEGLDEVIVRSRIQPSYTIGKAIAGSEHQNARRLACPSNFAQNGETIPPGQHPSSTIKSYS